SGNFATIFTLRDRGYDPLAFRYLCLKAHYRAPMKFSWEILDGASTGYQRLRREVLALSSSPAGVSNQHPDLAVPAQRYAKEIEDAFLDDLAIPLALTLLQRALADLALSANDRVALAARFDAILGLGLTAPLDERVPGSVSALVS